MKNQIKWSKITKNKLPPINKYLLLFNNFYHGISYIHTTCEKKFEDYMYNDWSHWAEVNFPIIRVPKKILIKKPKTTVEMYKKGEKAAQNLINNFPKKTLIK